MKKIYVRPSADVVNLKLAGSVMDDDYIETPVGGYSLVGKPEDSFGKENNFGFDDDAFGDIWGSEDENPNDLWGED